MATNRSVGRYRRDAMESATTNTDTSTADEQVQAVRSEAAVVGRRLRVTDGQLRAQGISPKRRRLASRRIA